MIKRIIYFLNVLTIVWLAPMSFAVDQCNTTQECKNKFGSPATDCLNSQKNDSVCMCGNVACDTGTPSSKATSSKAASSKAPTTSSKPVSSSGFSDVVQPPASCSNIGNSIPQNIKLHNIHSSKIERANFADAARWYTERGNVQRFQLHDGDTNLRGGTDIKRPRIEAHVTPWKRNPNGSEWHEFSANYYLASWEEAQRYALLQIKTNDSSNWIIQVLVFSDNTLKVARRGKGSIQIDSNLLRKPFNLRVRSNGFKFEVWYNCQLVLAENHPSPDSESNATNYGWRWGLYRQKADDDKQDGTTTLYVTGPKFN